MLIKLWVQYPLECCSMDILASLPPARTPGIPREYEPLNFWDPGGCGVDIYYNIS